MSLLAGFGLAVMLLPGCASNVEPTAAPVDGGADTTASQDAVLSVDAAPKCCAIQRTCSPSVWGTREDGSCDAVYDVSAVGGTIETDARGCPRLSVATMVSCFVTPDSGTSDADAGFKCCALNGDCLVSTTGVDGTNADGTCRISYDAVREGATIAYDERGCPYWGAGGTTRYCMGAFDTGVRDGARETSTASDANQHE